MRCETRLAADTPFRRPIVPALRLTRLRNYGVASTAAITGRLADPMHHKRLMIQGLSSFRLAAENQQASGLCSPDPSGFRICYLSSKSLRLRGGHGLPALIAARFNSRIATICRPCDLVN